MARIYLVLGDEIKLRIHIRLRAFDILLACVIFIQVRNATKSTKFDLLMFARSHPEVAKSHRTKVSDRDSSSNTLASA